MPNISQVNFSKSVQPQVVHSPKSTSFIAKVTGLVLSLLALAQPAAGVAFAPYGLKGRVDNAPVTKTLPFPEGLAQFHYNGLVETDGGKGSCSLERGVQPLDGCKETYTSTLPALRRQAPELVAEWKATPLEERRNGGFAQFDPDRTGVLHTVRFFANPNMQRNQKAVLALLDERVLSSPQGFFAQSEEDLLQFLVKMQEKFCDGVAGEEGRDVKGLRSEPAAVRPQFPTDTSITDDWTGYLTNRGASDADLRVLKRIFLKFDKVNTLLELRDALSAREREVLEKIIFFPPSPEEVRPQMLTFLKELKEVGPRVLANEADPLAVAAWVHQEIVRIHPFSDHNGHVARAWMQTILHLGGKEAFVIPDDDTYTEAVVKDHEEPGTFVDYMRQVGKWNEDQKEVLKGDYGFTGVSGHDILANPEGDSPKGGLWIHWGFGA